MIILAGTINRIPVSKKKTVDLANTVGLGCVLPHADCGVDLGEDTTRARSFTSQLLSGLAGGLDEVGIVKIVSDRDGLVEFDSTGINQDLRQ